MRFAMITSPKRGQAHISLATIIIVSFSDVQKHVSTSTNNPIAHYSRRGMAGANTTNASRWLMQKPASVRRMGTT